MYYKNNFRKILEFANFSSLRELKPREYYQIYSIWYLLVPHLDLCSVSDGKESEVFFS